MKKFFVLCVTSAALALASADSYRITLFQPSTVGGTELKPGEYKVEVNDAKMTIHNGKNKVEAAVKVESTNEKFSSTSVRYSTGDNGKMKISEIRIGGTKTKLVVDGAAAQGL